MRWKIQLAVDLHLSLSGTHACHWTTDYSIDRFQTGSVEHSPYPTIVPICKYNGQLALLQRTEVPPKNRWTELNPGGVTWRVPVPKAFIAPF